MQKKEKNYTITFEKSNSDFYISYKRLSRDKLSVSNDCPLKTEKNEKLETFLK